MKNVLLTLAALALATSAVFAQGHGLQVDDGSGHFWTINGPSSGSGTYTIQSGGGTIVTQTGAGVSTLNGHSYTWPSTSTNGVLTNTGGTLSWQAAGSGSVAGSNTQIQYNNSGAFGANANFIFDATNTTLSVGEASGYGSNVKVNMKDGHLRSRYTTAPTGTAIAAGIGNAGTVTLANATDVAGKITLHTQGNPNAGDQATITFNQAYNVAPIVVITPGNANAAAVYAYISNTTPTTTTTFTIAFQTSGGNNKDNVFYYHVIETQ